MRHYIPRAVPQGIVVSTEVDALGLTGRCMVCINVLAFEEFNLVHNYTMGMVGGG